MRTKKYPKQTSNLFVNKQTVTKFFLPLLMLLSIVFLMTSLRNTTYFPIREVKIIGAEHVDHDAVQQLIKPLVGQGFFAVDLTEIKERLAQFPWIARVMVQRVWPNEVFVKIIEKNPVARWNETQLLSTEGELFQPDISTFHTDLPRFMGPDADSMQVFSYYKKINNALTPLHFKIVSLELTPYSYWRIILDNGVKLTAGQKDILTRLDHFVKLYPKIIGDRASEVEYIDLRYSNGIAVKWKTII